MPNFFPFIPGTETSRVARQHASDFDSSPLLGRFRAVPRSLSQQQHSRNPFSVSRRRRASSSSSYLAALLSAGGRGSVHVGYGALVTAALESDDDSGNELYDSDDEGVSWLERAGRAVARSMNDLWVAPRQGAVKKVVESWWRRWGLLVFLPAGLVSLHH
jgi:hypothetical protein